MKAYQCDNCANFYVLDEKLIGGATRPIVLRVFRIVMDQEVETSRLDICPDCALRFPEAMKMLKRATQLISKRKAAADATTEKTDTEGVPSA